MRERHKKFWEATLPVALLVLVFMSPGCLIAVFLFGAMAYIDWIYEREVFTSERIDAFLAINSLFCGMISIVLFAGLMAGAIDSGIMVFGHLVSCIVSMVAYNRV